MTTAARPTSITYGWGGGQRSGRRVTFMPGSRLSHASSTPPSEPGQGGGQGQGPLRPGYSAPLPRSVPLSQHLQELVSGVSGRRFPSDSATGAAVGAGGGAGGWRSASPGRGYRGAGPAPGSEWRQSSASPRSTTPWAVQVDAGRESLWRPASSSPRSATSSHPSSRSPSPGQGQSRQGQGQGPGSRGRRSEQRPGMTPPSRLRCRLLGADRYPRLGRRLVEQEKALFRAGVGVIESLFSQAGAGGSAPPSRWGSLGGGAGGHRVAYVDHVCEASRAEALKNNAQLARIYHVVPQRVISARAGRNQEVSVTLQRLNQSTCHRRNSGTITDNNDIGNATNVSNKTNSKTSRSTRKAGGQTTTPEVKEETQRGNSVVRIPTGDENRDGEGRIPGGIPAHALRGVNTQEHSREWLEETKMKQEESVAILSEQLKTMMPADEGEIASLATEGWWSNAGETSTETPEASPRPVGPASPSSLAGYRHDTPSSPRQAACTQSSSPAVFGPGGRPPLPSNADDDEATPEVRRRCMRTMQCEVLGPYSCADCTRLRQHERGVQGSPYPGLVVDPRSLVAPDRLRRLNATLPPGLSAQGSRLDCGCAVNMHPDFLFPVLVTDHAIHSRVRALKSAPAEQPRPQRLNVSPADSDTDSLPGDGGGGEDGEGGEGRRREEGLDGRSRDEEDEKVSMSPSDMKVTVRYGSPPSSEKQPVVSTC